MSEKETYEAPALTEIGEATELTREIGPYCREGLGGSGPGVAFNTGKCPGTAFS